MRKWEQMRAFLSECYRPDHAICSKKFFEWQFQVDSNNGNARLMCAWNDDRLLGILGYLPLLVNWGEIAKPYESAWLLYWMVRKEALRGLGLLLIRKIHEMYPLLLTVNASPMGQPILTSLGYTFFKSVPRYISVFDKQQCSNMLLDESMGNDLDAYVFKSARSESLNISETKLNERNYRPDWHFYNALSFGTIRSLEYLTWRYIDHPGFKYHVVIEGDPERPAVCVYRIEKAFGDYEAMVGRIVDSYFPCDVEGRKRGMDLVFTVLQHLKSIGCAFADLFCSNEIYGQLFIDLGGGMEPTDRQIFPVRLTPIQRVIRYQNFGFFAPKGLPLPDLKNLYVTKSDIDGDSPVSRLLIGR